MIINLAVPVVAAISYGALLFIVLQHRLRSQAHRTLALYLLIMTVWSLGSLMLHAGLFASALFWLMVNTYSSAAMPVMRLHRTYERILSRWV